MTGVDMQVRKPTSTEEVTLWSDYDCVKAKSLVKRLIYQRGPFT